jgi:hypothetical protein
VSSAIAKRDRFQLLFGPYLAPPVRLGQILHCALRGDLEVVGISAGKARAAAQPTLSSPERRAAISAALQVLG